MQLHLLVVDILSCLMIDYYYYNNSHLEDVFVCVEVLSPSKHESERRERERERERESW